MATTPSLKRSKQKKGSFILSLAPYRILTFFVKCLMTLGTSILMLRRLYVVEDNEKRTRKRKSTKEAASTIATVMQSKNCRVVIFFGSQTGTAESYAQKIAKDCKSKYGLDPIVAPLDQYDMKYLDSIPTNAVAVFVVASYGEGEPTDNAVTFFNLVETDAAPFSKNSEMIEEQPLSGLRYCLFGLGNSSYPVFNGACKTLDKKLMHLGARRLGDRGEGDDNSSMEEDYINWTENSLWPQLESALKLEASEEDATSVLTTYKVDELDASSVPVTQKVYSHGEQSTLSSSTYSASNPYPAPVKIRSLYPATPEGETDDRHCMHLDIDLSGTNLTYKTGDHIAIFPQNNQEIVSQLADKFGLTDKLDNVIQVTSLVDPSSKKTPFPVPTTYRAALMHYLDISKVPSRQDLKTLTAFVHSDAAKAYMGKLVNDLALYKTTVVDAHLTLVDVLNTADKEHTFEHVPFALLIDFFGRLQPRYYSISSSNSETPSTASATCVTLKYHPTKDRTVYGVNTNYLWSMYEKNENLESTLPIHYAIAKDSSNKLPIYIRQANNFKMPSDLSVPIVMVGPGTGVAPFRGFVRERAFQKTAHGAQVGPTLLFFGCRTEHDYLYKDEWPALFQTLGSDSGIITAFSRMSEKKVYVQHEIKNHGKQVWDLLSKGAYFYVCGDANKMARDVQRAVADLAKEYGEMNEDDAVKYVSSLRKQNRYQEDVWA